MILHAGKSEIYRVGWRLRQDFCYSLRLNSFLSRSRFCFCCCLVTKSGEGNGTPLQYSCLESPRDWGAWWAAVSGVAKSRTRLSNFTSTFHFHALEKEMATHSSDLAWSIPGTGEPGGLLSMGSCRVGHDWNDLAAAAAKCKRIPIIPHFQQYLVFSVLILIVAIIMGVLLFCFVD